jgi:hypothetical protein
LLIAVHRVLHIPCIIDVFAILAIAQIIAIYILGVEDTISDQILSSDIHDTFSDGFFLHLHPLSLYLMYRGLQEKSLVYLTSYWLVADMIFLVHEIGR